MEKDKSQMSDDQEVALNISPENLAILLDCPAEDVPSALDNRASQKLFAGLTTHDRSYPFVGVCGAEEVDMCERHQLAAGYCFAMAVRSAWQNGHKYRARMDPDIVVAIAKEECENFAEDGIVSLDLLKWLSDYFNLDFEPEVIRTDNPQVALTHFFKGADVFLGAGGAADGTATYIYGLATSVHINTESGELFFHGNFPMLRHRAIDRPFPHESDSSTYTCVLRRCRPNPVTKSPGQHAPKWDIPMYKHPTRGWIPEYTKEYSGVPLPRRKEDKSCNSTE